MRGVRVRGEAIRLLRTSQGLTQDQLAQRADIDVTTLRKMEKGDKAFDVHSVVALADALECDFTALIAPDTSRGEPDSREQANLACVARHREAFFNRDVERVLSCYTDDAVLRYPSSIPSPAAGLFEGRDAIRKHLELMFQTFQAQIPSVEKPDLYAFDDRVILRHTFSAVVLHNGAQFSSDCLFEFWFRDGKICQHIGLFDTAAMANALNAPRKREA